MKGFPKSVVVLAVASVTGAVGTRADVLCQHKGSGLVGVHAACHKRELPLDLSQFGVQEGATGTNTNNAAAADGAPCTLGQILLTASTSVTAGGVPANGQVLQISDNAPLYALFGTTYGGDGKTTFALPDLRGLAPNNMTYSICDRNGIFPQRR